MEISHLVTVGCSFTYCQGLPTNQGWPTLVAKELNLPLVNLGIPGVGNDCIHRKTYEYVYNNFSSGGAVPFIVIAYSQPWRKEAWSKTNYKNNNFHDYAPINLPDDKPTNYLEYALLENWNEEDFHRKTLLYKLSLKNLFENLNIPYIMTDAMDQEEDNDAYSITIKKYPGLCPIKNKFYIEPIYKLVKSLPTLECGHWTFDSNVIVSKFLIKSILELYPNLKYKNNKFLTLEEYVEVDKYHQKFTEWC